MVTNADAELDVVDGSSYKQLLVFRTHSLRQLRLRRIEMGAYTAGPGRQLVQCTSGVRHGVGR